MCTDLNRAYMLHASSLFPGGVNSPVRSMSAVGGDSLCIERGEGCYLWDLNGQRYIDYIGGWGPAIVGHAHPQVMTAVQQAMAKGFVFGTNTPGEVLLAERLQARLPSLEKMRFTSSGTEATMSLVRLARGYTGRPLIVKFDGCFHGHVDSLLVKAGSGLLTLGLPNSLGILPCIAEQTIVLPYNDQDAFTSLMTTRGHDIAAVIVEPIAGNMAMVVPSQSWLSCLRDLCTQVGALLIFDEVMTGLRVHRDSAQGLFGIHPDLTALGKVVGGGMPLAVYGGRAEIMNCVAPMGGVYQSGTLSGHPLSTAAGAAVIALTNAPGFYERLTVCGEQLVHGLLVAAERAGFAPFQAQSVGGLFSVYFLSALPRDYGDMVQTDTQLFASFFQKMLKRGVLFPPSAFEACFLSSVHTEAVIEETVAVAGEVFREMVQESSSRS